ncbi:hypothetical protein V6N13_071758 [Hibiscus sabdariffa]
MITFPVRISEIPQPGANTFVRQALYKGKSQRMINESQLESSSTSEKKLEHDDSSGKKTTLELEMALTQAAWGTQIFRTASWPLET